MEAKSMFDNRNSRVTMKEATGNSVRRHQEEGERRRLEEERRRPKEECRRIEDERRIQREERRAEAEAARFHTLIIQLGFPRPPAIEHSAQSYHSIPHLPTFLPLPITAIVDPPPHRPSFRMHSFRLSRNGRIILQWLTSPACHSAYNLSSYICLSPLRHNT